MESATAPGMANFTSAHGPNEEYSPLTDGYGGFVDLSSLSGHHGQPPRLQTEDIYTDDLIGISLSPVQTQMRSPDTPAFDKARALGVEVDYFRRVLSLVEEPDQDSDTDKASDSQPGTPHEELRPPALFQNKTGRSVSLVQPKDSTSYGEVDESPDLSFDHHSSVQVQAPDTSPHETRPREYQLPPQPIREPSTPPTAHHIFQQPGCSENEIPVIDDTHDGAHTSQSHRLSVTKSILSGAGGDRKRSLSGSSMFFANLRKLLPDLPTAQSNRSSISVLTSSRRNSGQQSPTSGANTPTSRSFMWSMREPPQSRGTGDTAHSGEPEGTTAHVLTTVPRNQLDGNAESLLTPTSPASNATRVRSNSEGSLFMRRRVTGASAYDDTTAFANVTDLANSRFKAITDSFQNSTIKLPRLPAIRPAAKRRPSPDQANDETSRDLGTGPDGQAYSHQYTTVKKMRNVSKGVVVETSQQRAHPVLSDALSKAEGDIVVLGGYRGSILRSAKPPHRQVWVPIKVGLNLRKVDLEVGLTRGDEERMEQTIIPDGILSNIGPIDICKRLLKHLRKCPNTRDNKLRVHNWGYDWRLSPDLLSGKLIKFLESLESNHPETPHEKRGAIVVAHSLGGLITRHAVNQRPDLFAGVVFAGTPQHCVNILGPLRNGDDVLLSSRVLTAQVNFTIRTSFALLPEDGRCFIQKHTNRRYDLDFFDPYTWEEYHLSPCINPPLEHRLREKDKDDRGRSIMGVLSDSITASNKRNSWFGTGPPPGKTSQHTATRDTLEAVEQQTNDRALGASQDDQGHVEGMVGPSIKQDHHRPTVATAVTIPKDLAAEYLDRILAEVRVFKQELRFIPSHQENNIYPPHAFIFGKTVPTVYGVRVPNEEAIKYTDAFDDLAFAAGDGVVLASAAQLPDGYRCVKGGRVESDRGHVGIMGDLEGMGRCIGAVIDARRKGVGLGTLHARYSRDLSDVVEPRVL